MLEETERAEGEPRREKVEGDRPRKGERDLRPYAFEVGRAAKMVADAEGEGRGW